MTTTENTTFAAGWYPDVNVPGTERYYDGTQWTEQTRAATTGIPPQPPTPLAGERKGKKKGKKGKVVLGAVVGAIVLIGAVNAISGGGSDDADVSTADSAEQAATEEQAAAEPVAEPATEEAPAEDAAEVEAAAPEQGDVANPFPQPYTAKGLLGGEKYSLTGRVADANANAAVAGYNMYNEEAPVGFKYVIVELTMTGIDPEGVEPSLASFDLSLATPEGNRYDTEFIVYAEGMADMSDGPTLYPGSSFTGYTAYIVPEGVESFLLYDNGNYISF